MELPTSDLSHVYRTSESISPRISGEADGLTYCLREIENVLWIEGNPILHTALKDWERQEELLSSRIERKKSLQENVSNEIIKLIVCCCIFQSLLLIVVALLSQNGAAREPPVRLESRIYCVALSCAASLSTILAVEPKLRRFRGIVTSIRFEEQVLGEVRVRVQELRRCGDRFQFSDKTCRELPRRRVSLPSIVLVSALFGIACLFPILMWRSTNE
jgi:hypothetical protein